MSNGIFFMEMFYRCFIESVCTFFFLFLFSAAIVCRLLRARLQDFVRACSKIAAVALSDLSDLHEIRSVRKVRLIPSDPSQPFLPRRVHAAPVSPIRIREILPRCKTDRLKHPPVLVVIGFLNDRTRYYDSVLLF